jgi:RNA-binding protein
MLTAATKRKLRQTAHHLKPVVLVGQHGVTAPVIAEIERALTDHELIKVRFRGLERDERNDEIMRMAAELSAEVVSTIGGTAVLYRLSPVLEAKRRKS